MWNRIDAILGMTGWIAVTLIATVLLACWGWR
jgi:hypothetical protein